MAGSQPRHTCPSPMSMCASSSTSSLVLVRFRSRLLAASGSRVVSLCLSRCSGVGRAGGLASLSPFVGVVQAAGIFASVRGFGGRRGRGLSIPLPVLGCRKGCRYPRDCPGLRGVHGARGLASPGPFLGAKADFILGRVESLSVLLVLLFVLASGCFWSHLFIQLPKVFVPRLLKQCRLVFLLLGLVFLGRGGGARGFISRFCFGVDWFHASWLRFLWGLRARGLSLAFGVGVSSRPCTFVGCLGWFMSSTLIPTWLFLHSVT